MTSKRHPKFRVSTGEEPHGERDRDGWSVRFVHIFGVYEIDKGYFLTPEHVAILTGEITTRTKTAVTITTHPMRTTIYNHMLAGKVSRGTYSLSPLYYAQVAVHLQM